MKIYSSGNGTPLVYVNIEDLVAESPDSFDSVTGKLTYRLPRLNTCYALGTLPDGITELNIEVPLIDCTIIPSGTVEFSTAGGVPNAVTVSIIHDAPKPATPVRVTGNAMPLEANKTYQLTIANDCATLIDYNEPWGKPMTPMVSTSIDNLDTLPSGMTWSSETGTLTYSAPRLNTFYDLGTIPSGVTNLTIAIDRARSGYLTEAALQFTVTDTPPESVSILINGTPAYYAGDFESLEGGMTYQVTIVNNCAVIGAFE